MNEITKQTKETTLKFRSIDSLSLIMDACRGIDDEYYSVPGSYSCCVLTSEYGTNHNYMIYFSRLRSKKWKVYVELCIECKNRGTKLYSQEFKTLKSCKSAASEFIKKFDLSDSADDIIKDWKRTHAQAIFTFKDKQQGLDGGLMLIGGTYTYTNYSENKEFRYINTDWDYCKDTVTNTKVLYTLTYYSDSFLIWKETRDIWSSIGEGVKDDKILADMISLLRESGMKQFDYLISQYDSGHATSN